MDASDTTLVAACLDGDRQAFARLVERHQDAVYNLAYRMTGQAADAADLAQEAFIKAYRKLHTYNPAYTFRNWLLGICANQTRNFFRHTSRRIRLEEEHARLEPGPEGAPVDDRREALSEALQSLPEKTRLPLVLKYMEDLSHEEIARILKLGVSAVKMRILRGREELARQLQAAGRAS